MLKLLVYVSLILSLIYFSTITSILVADTELVSFQNIERKNVHGKHSFKNFFLKLGAYKNMWMDLNAPKKNYVEHHLSTLQNGKMICNQDHTVIEVKVIREEKIMINEKHSQSELTLVAVQNTQMKEYLGKYSLVVWHDEDSYFSPSTDFTNFEGYLVCLVKGSIPQLVPKKFEREIFIEGPWVVPVIITIKTNPLMPYNIHPMITTLENFPIVESKRTSFLWPYGMQTIYDAFLMVKGEEAFKKKQNCVLERKSKNSEVKLRCDGWDKITSLLRFNLYMLSFLILGGVINGLHGIIPEITKVKYYKDPYFIENPMQSENEQTTSMNDKSQEAEESKKWFKTIVEDENKDFTKEEFVHDSYNKSVNKAYTINGIYNKLWLVTFLSGNLVGILTEIYKLKRIISKVKEKIHSSPFAYPWKIATITDEEYNKNPNI